MSVTATHHANSPAVAAAPRRRQRVTVRRSFALLLLIGFTLNVVQSLHDATREGRLPGWAFGSLLALLGGFGAVAAIARRKEILRTVTHLRFGIAQFGALTLATMLGTFVLQGAAPDAFTAQYGGAARALQWLHWDDLFHSYAFASLLAVSAFSQALLVVRRKAWRWREIGFLFAHGGVVVLLLGAVVGSAFGGRGMVHLMVGQSAGAFRPDAGGAMTDMPFAIRLEGFDITRRTPEYRLYVLDKAEDKGWKAARSLDAQQPGVHDVKGVGRVEVVRFEPHPDPVTEVVAGSSQPRNPAIRIRAGRGSGWLFANDPQKSRVPIGGTDVSVRFTWGEPLPSGTARSAQHLLRVDGGPEIPVTPGQRLRIGDATWQVGQALMNFRWDLKAKRAFSAGNRPENPAIALAKVEDNGTTGPVRWVFGPGRGMGHQKDLPVVYRYAPGRVAGKVVTLIGSTRTAVYTEDGVEKHRGPFGLDRAFDLAGVSFAVQEVLADARIETKRLPDDAPPSNPAVTLRVPDEAGAVHELVLREEGRSGVAIGDGRAIRFAKKSDDIQNFTSTVGIVKDGALVETAQVSVNHPLRYGAYQIYHPSYAGLLVVKDPAIDGVYAGLLFMVLGVIHILFIRNRRSRGGRIPSEVSA